jgi:hypothetical protein
MGILSITAKCTDLCQTEYINKRGMITKTDGYVPRNIGIGAGDYVVLDIDMETGQIQNWKPVTDSQVIESLKECENETNS